MTLEPRIRPLASGDASWVRETLEQLWGSVLVARRGELVDASSLPGFLAEVGGRRVGLVVVAPRGPDYEIVSLSTAVEGVGVGRTLMRRSVEDARALGCARVWVTTTNNNVRALGFYQRFGMELCAVRLRGVDASRRVKPSIPLVDDFGVPIPHELELELHLAH